jgi:hypothetical protein
MFGEFLSVLQRKENKMKKKFSMDETQLSHIIYQKLYVPRVTDWFQWLSMLKGDKQLQQSLALVPLESIFQQP